MIFDRRNIEIKRSGGKLQCAIMQLFLSKTGIMRLFIPNYNHGYIIYFYGVALRSIQKKCISYLYNLYVFFLNLLKIGNNKLLTKVLILINLLMAVTCTEIKVSLHEGNLAEN
jgi:hypothetical protein